LPLKIDNKSSDDQRPFCVFETGLLLSSRKISDEKYLAKAIPIFQGTKFAHDQLTNLIHSQITAVGAKHSPRRFSFLPSIMQRMLRSYNYLNYKGLNHSLKRKMT